MPLYALGPIHGLRIRRLVARMEAFVPPEAAPHWQPAGDAPAAADAAAHASAGDGIMVA